jgi:Fic family protein
MLRQLKAIEQTTGFLKAVDLRPDWIAEVRSRVHAQEALASLQIEGNSLTLEEAFALAQQVTSMNYPFLSRRSVIERFAM